MKPRLLDLFCGAGGAAKGYQRAGFYVVGVDHYAQPHYCGDEFIQAGALHVPFDGFDAIHASPPCQAHTRAGELRKAQGGTPSTRNMIPATRDRLLASGLPFVIENVEGAPLSGTTLCGSGFGLKVRRHRIFESNVPLCDPPPCDHRSQGRPIGVYYKLADDIPSGGSTARTVEEGREAMGIDWMDWEELVEAIPPAYTEWIGQRLMDAVRVFSPVSVCPLGDDERRIPEGGSVNRKKPQPFSVTLDHVGHWVGEPDARMEVGGEGTAWQRGGYIWIGNTRCIGFIGIGKFLRLARAIERRRAKSRPRKPSVRKP